MTPSSLASGASNEENRPHLRPHLRPHHLRPYGRLASPCRPDRLRPQHGSRLHHHGGVVPANLLRHPQLPRQHPRRPNLLRPGLRLRHPNHLSPPSATSPCGRSSTSTSCPTLWTATSPRRFTRSSPPDLTLPPPPRRSLPYNALSSSTKTPSSTWPTPS